MEQYEPVYCLIEVSSNGGGDLTHKALSARELVRETINLVEDSELYVTLEKPNLGYEDIEKEISNLKYIESEKYANIGPVFRILEFKDGKCTEITMSQFKNQNRQHYIDELGELYGTIQDTR